jgi:hypothetical protein
MTNVANVTSSQSVQSLKNDIHALENLLQKSRSRQDWWNAWYLRLGVAALVIATLLGIASWVCQKKASNIEYSSRPTVDTLAIKNVRLREVIDHDAQLEVAKAQKDAFDASTRAGIAEQDAGEANERAAKAQASLALAEQHSVEANAKAEGFRLDIAKANESAEQARAQVASATAEAAKANLELERIKAPRTLSNVATLTESLKAYKGTEYTFSSVFGDEESIMLLRQIDAALSNSGWVRVKPPHAYPAINVYGQEQDFAVASGLTLSIKISVSSDIPLATLQATPMDKLPAPTGAAVALATALTGSLNPPQESGIKANVEPGNSPTVRIEVGKKP